MASRRLALNLTQGLRNRAALNAVAPLKRGFATPVVKNGVKTESTTLSNGLTVRMEIRSDGKLLTFSDCYGALAMGTDVDCRGVD